jgi:hypothetical protein
MTPSGVRITNPTKQGVSPKADREGHVHVERGGYLLAGQRPLTELAAVRERLRDGPLCAGLRRNLRLQEHRRAGAGVVGVPPLRWSGVGRVADADAAGP